jgi:predicted tellurium resistance membrane protein TerC
MRAQPVAAHADGTLAGAGRPPQKPFSRAVWQIVAADLSMSVDNVLAVAGAAEKHPLVLVFGLALSVVLMGVAANYIARLLGRWRWIGYVGLAVITLVALNMIYRGGIEVMHPF